MDAKQRPAFQKDLRGRTKAFALRIVRMFSELPKTTEAQVLGKQLLRSGTSTRESSRSVSRAEQSGVHRNAAIHCGKLKKAPLALPTGSPASLGWFAAHSLPP